MACVEQATIKWVDTDSLAILPGTAIFHGVLPTARGMMTNQLSLGQKAYGADIGRKWVRVGTLSGVLVVLAALAPTPAPAEPIGKWWSGWGQGVTEIGIKNDSAGSDEIYIACSQDRPNHTTISFTIGGKNPRPGSSVFIVIGSDTLEFPIDEHGNGSTNTHVAADNFTFLWDAIRRGRWMVVRLATGESTRFMLAGAAAALRGKENTCKPDFYP